MLIINRIKFKYDSITFTISTHIIVDDSSVFGFDIDVKYFWFLVIAGALGGGSYYARTQQPEQWNNALNLEGDGA